MTNRWTIEEESKLLKLIASGKTCRELSGANYNFNRSENALELRLKKIIYENINNNKSPDKISQLLNIPRDKIMQSYYSYKDYIEKQKQNGGISDNDNKNLSISNNMSNKINNLHNNFNKQDIKQNDIKQNGGDSIGLDRIERQNRKMKLLLENYILKQKLAKLLKNNNNNLQKQALDALIKN
jgi:hypothetical protein